MQYTRFDPEDQDKLRRFLTSAKSIMVAGQTYSPSLVTKALNESWQTYAGNVDVRTLTQGTQKALTTMMKKYPGFKPINETGNKAMMPAKGKGLPHGKASGEMPKTKEPKFSEIDSKNDLIKRKPKSDCCDTPTVKGTGVGMEALANQDPALVENVARLTKYVRRSLLEAAKSPIRNASYAMLIREGEEIAKTPTRYSLAEAIADAEELLLFHRPENVKMLVNYTSERGRTGKMSLNMLSISARDPIFSEGKALFRFQRNAENFARELAAEGITSKLSDHRWGFSLFAESKISLVKRAFKKII